MAHYGLNDCTNLPNIIDIMNSLTTHCNTLPRQVFCAADVRETYDTAARI